MTLTEALASLSEAIHVAYEMALDANRRDVAIELHRMDCHVAIALSMSLRAEVPTTDSDQMWRPGR
jgi:uncharacterized protein YicC (UPF0701 family)